MLGVDRLCASAGRWAKKEEGIGGKALPKKSAREGLGDDLPKVRLGRV